jgi:hypothetical protein
VYRDSGLDEIVRFREANGHLTAGLETLARYRSRFRDWQQRASVRTRPPRVLREPARDELYFSRPVASRSRPQG